MKYFDENDVDIDELLSDAPDLIAGQKIAPKKETTNDIFNTLPIEETTDTFDTDNTFGSDDPFADTSSQTEEDPFADSLNTDENTSDPFGGFDEDSTERRSFC